MRLAILAACLLSSSAFAKDSEAVITVLGTTHSTLAGARGQHVEMSQTWEEARTSMEIELLKVEIHDRREPLKG